MNSMYIHIHVYRCIDLNREWLGRISQQEEEKRKREHERRLEAERHKYEREEAERRREFERRELERRRQHAEIESRRSMAAEKLKLQQLQEQRAMAESLMTCDAEKLAIIKQILELHLQEKLYDRSIGRRCKYMRPPEEEEDRQRVPSTLYYRSRSAANLRGSWNII